MNKALKHYEESVFVPASAEQIFAFVNDHKNLSSHMNESSWMMMGSMMNTKIDKNKGQKIGSHITMNGKILGINLFLDEIVTIYEPPVRKEWQTVGKINLLVIGHYKLGFIIKPTGQGSDFNVYIDYELPKSLKTRWLGFLFGDWYAKWCVGQMLTTTIKEFKK